MISLRFANLLKRPETGAVLLVRELLDACSSRENSHRALMTQQRVHSGS